MVIKIKASEVSKKFSLNSSASHVCVQAAGSNAAARVHVLLRHDGVWRREKSYFRLAIWGREGGHDYSHRTLLL